jgi:hypothetical protein
MTDDDEERKPVWRLQHEIPSAGTPRGPVSVPLKGSRRQANGAGPAGTRHSPLATRLQSLGQRPVRPTSESFENTENPIRSVI